MLLSGQVPVSNLALGTGFAPIPIIAAVAAFRGMHIDSRMHACCNPSASDWHNYDHPQKPHSSLPRHIIHHG
jgi:hypothetical protein